MGGGGKGGGGGGGGSQDALNFQIVQWITDQETQKQVQAKQDEYNAQMLEITKQNNATQADQWNRSFALQQEQLNAQRSWYQSQSAASASATGNVSKDEAAKSSQGQAQAGRVKTLYSAANARTRGNRVVLGSSDNNNQTVFKRVLGE
jgi:hypothetical protein